MSESPDHKDSQRPQEVDLFGDDEPLKELDGLITEALSRRATRLLLLAGKSVVCRVDGRLSEPLLPGRLHFRQTEKLVKALLSDEQLAALDEDGAVEIEYEPGADGTSAAGTGPLHINVFFGDGAHNMVVFFE